MHTHRNTLLLAAVAAFTLAAPAAAQATHETQAKLKAEAKISMADARKIALAKVPKGRVKSAELEREHDVLLYSFDIATKGKPGIDEVQVNAVTGALVGDVVHETKKMEKAEMKAEMKEKMGGMKGMKGDMMGMKHDSTMMKHDSTMMMKHDGMMKPGSMMKRDSMMMKHDSTMKIKHDSMTKKP